MVDRNRKSVFAAILTIALFLPALALPQSGKMSDAEKVKAAANTYLASGKVKVSVETKDGRSYMGFITSVEDDHFVLYDPDAARQVQIRYDNVVRLRKRGLSKAAKTAIWIGVGAGIGTLIIFGRPGRKIGPICPLGCGL